MLPNADFKKLLTLIPQLSSEQSATILQRLRGCSALTGNKILTVQQDYLLEGLLQELYSRGLLMKGKRLFGPLVNEYKDRCEGVRAHLNEGIPSEAKYIQRVLIARHAVSALADYLERGRVPVVVSTLVQNLEKIPVALEHAYPGYWRSMLLLWLAGGPGERTVSGEPSRINSRSPSV